MRRGLASSSWLFIAPAAAALVACHPSPNETNLMPPHDASASGGEPADAAIAAPDARDAASPADGAAAPDGGACAAQGSPAIAALPNLALRYQGTFTTPPSQTDTQETTDAPLLGNGDVGVAILGTIDAMTFIRGKTEFS